MKQFLVQDWLLEVHPASVMNGDWNSVEVLFWVVVSNIIVGQNIRNPKPQLIEPQPFNTYFEGSRQLYPTWMRSSTRNRSGQDGLGSWTGGFPPNRPKFRYGPDRTDLGLARGQTKQTRDQPSARRSRLKINSEPD